MSTHVNKIIAEGFCGGNPEMRYLPDGTAVTTVNVGCSKSKKDAAGQWKAETEWYEVTCWREKAERANQALAKGDHVLVIGRHHIRTWEKKDGGGIGFKSCIDAEQVQYLGIKKVKGGQAGQAEEERPFD